MTYCTYKTTHPSGLYYLGKGITEKVRSGEYIGSGVRLKLALTRDEYARDTWKTKVLDEYKTEDEAYEAEQRLVPHHLLSDPMCMNMHEGGRKGRYKTHGALLKSIHASIRKEKAILRKAKQKLKEKKLKEKIKELRK